MTHLFKHTLRLCLAAHKGPWVAALAALAMAAAPAGQARLPDAALLETLARVGERVEQWYSRAQHIVAREDVWIQPLRHDLSSLGVPRHLAYELRLAWDPEAAVPGTLPEASVLRHPVSINGRPLRTTDEPGCLDPKPVSPEPLAMLLAAQRDNFVFSAAGTTRVRGRSALMVDYRGVRYGAPEITWRDECVSISLPGRSKGRVWIDVATHDVLRLDEHLIGQFEFDVPRDQVRRGAAASMMIERADSSIEFRRVEFQDPAETLVLPAAVSTVTVVRGGGVQRTRITQRMSGYRRFLTDGRLVQEE